MNIHWRTLIVSSSRTPSLEQAIEWHTNLVDMRGKASWDLEHGSPFDDAAMTFRGAFWYASDFQVQGVRCTTPCMRDLRSVLGYRHKLEAAAGAKGREGIDKCLEGFRSSSTERRSLLFWHVQAELNHGTVPPSSMLSRCLGA